MNLVRTRMFIKPFPNTINMKNNHIILLFISYSYKPHVQEPYGEYCVLSRQHRTPTMIHKFR